MAYIVKRGPLAGTYTTERQYRNTLARSEGFRTLDEKLKAARTNEYKDLLKTAKAEYKAETGHNLGNAQARHIANLAFNAPEKKEIYARDLTAAQRNNPKLNEDDFRDAFDKVVGSFDKDTYQDIKDGIIQLENIPYMDDYLDLIGEDENEYEMWYH